MKNATALVASILALLVFVSPALARDKSMPVQAFEACRFVALHSPASQATTGLDFEAYQKGDGFVVPGFMSCQTTVYTCTNGKKVDNGVDCGDCNSTPKVDTDGDGRDDDCESCCATHYDGADTINCKINNC